MAIPFLSQLARHYAAPEYSDLNGTLFVFPSRRSLVYFRDAMKNATGDPTTKIHGTTINDFFYRIHGVKPTDRLRLVMELYEVYKQVNPKAEPLDDFIFWGKTMIADFDNIDKYLADARGLFVNVSDFKAIQDTLEYLSEEQRRAIEQFLSHFRDSSGRLTVRPGDGSMKTRFLQVWDLLYPLYDGFKKRLGEKGLAYEGMVYRSLAEKIKGGSGIKSVKAFLDGRFILLEPLGKSAVLQCDLGESPVPRTGQVRTLRVVAVDNCGNENVFETKLKY